jgi:uncharacterized protein YjbJ (UPF0337 family)
LNIYSSEKRNKYLMNDRRNTMKSSIQETAEGKLHQLKGKSKQVLGKIFKNRKLENEGKAENLKGNVQEKIGQAKKVLGN